MIRKPNLRCLALTCLMTLSATSVANADSSTGETKHSFWKSFFGGNHKSAPPAKESGTTPLPTRQYYKPYTISLDAADDCPGIAIQIANAITNGAPPGITMTPAFGNCKYDETVTHEGISYRQATIEVSYEYAIQSGALAAPELNRDVLGGTSGPGDYSADGSEGLFPTYQSCLDAKASLWNGFQGETGATPVAYFCQTHDRITDLNDRTDEPAKSTGSSEPYRKYSLVIYSYGSKPEAKRLYVSQFPGTQQANLENKTAEMKDIYDILAGAGYTIAYPSDASQFDAQAEGTYIAYYASPYNLPLIQMTNVGETETVQECENDQKPKALEIWANLGALGTHGLCEPWTTASGMQSLVMISLGGTFKSYNHSIELAPENDDLNYATYGDCTNQGTQQEIIDRRGGPLRQGVLCVLKDSLLPQHGYMARLYTTHAPESASR